MVSARKSRKPTLAVLDRANQKYGLGLEWEHDQMGFVTLKSEGTTCPPRLLDKARAAAGVLLGPYRTTTIHHAKKAA